MNPDFRRREARKEMEIHGIIELGTRPRPVFPS
jgi:hypothetical protein